VLCVSCRGNGESPLVSIEFQEYHESDDEENEDEEAEAEAEESEADEEGDDDKREEEEEDVQEPQDEDEGEEPAEEVNEETKEGDGSKKPKHTKGHKMQLVVDNEMCRSCHNGRPLRYVRPFVRALVGFCSFLILFCFFTQVVLQDLSGEGLLLWLLRSMPHRSARAGQD
jgi:hypothetical protein